MELKLDLTAAPERLIAVHEMLGFYINGLAGNHLGVPMRGEASADVITGSRSAAAAFVARENLHGGDFENDVQTAERQAGINAKTGKPLDGAASAPPPDDKTPRDTKGVAFHIDFCAQAEDPFYASGPREGQWKKRRGTGDTEYDSWYAGELTKVRFAAASDTGAAVDTGSAFAGKGNGAAPPPPSIPADSGALMVWLSEHQTAQRLTQDDINAAWSRAGLAMGDIFAPTPPDAIAKNVAMLYQLLAPMAGA